jgi:arylsulfatase
LTSKPFNTYYIISSRINLQIFLSMKRKKEVFRRRFLGITSAAAAGILIFPTNAISGTGNKPVPLKRPNVILINCDDLGYAEIGCYGSAWKTANIDELARKGVRFTNFYAGNAYSSPSRAALMTGCYATRVGIPEVLFNVDTIGINFDEKTLAEVFKEAGYTTACVGKWHLGHLPPFLPTNNGFDEFYGIPYSHDMTPRNAQQARWHFPELPLIRGTQKIDEIKDPGILTRILTEYSVDFINRNKDNPFFLYLPHPMPHDPLAVSKKFADSTHLGRLADVITEIDWSVGEIMAELRKYNLIEKTIVIFTSDNGGTRDINGKGPFRGGKGTTFEGGSRAPFIISWPGVLPQGNEIGTHMDMLPTFCHFLGVPLPKKKIDGYDIWNLFECRREIKTPYEALFFFMGDNLESVRMGKWKYHISHSFKFSGRINGKIPTDQDLRIDESLFDLEKNIKEDINVIKEYPEVANRLRKYFNSWEKNFEKERRAPGRVNLPDTR